MIYLGICAVAEHYESIEGGIAGQPDLLQRTVPVVERFNLSPSGKRFALSFCHDLCLIFSQYNLEIRHIMYDATGALSMDQRSMKSYQKAGFMET